MKGERGNFAVGLPSSRYNNNNNNGGRLERLSAGSGLDDNDICPKVPRRYANQNRAASEARAPFTRLMG